MFARTARSARRMLPAAAGLSAVGLLGSGAALLQQEPRVRAYPAMKHADAVLAQLYHGLEDPHDIPADEARAIDDSGGHEAYGELTARGVRAVRAMLRPQHGDVVYDLGSGAGRAVLQTALEWHEISRAVGIELSDTRHAVGAAALARAPASLRARASLRRADMLLDGCRDANLVYVASLLFDEAFMRRLGAVLAAAPRLRSVATLREFPPGSLPGFVPDESNRARDADMLDERVEVTWGAARVYLYHREVKI